MMKCIVTSSYDVQQPVCEDPDASVVKMNSCLQLRQCMNRWLLCGASAGICTLSPCSICSGTGAEIENLGRPL